MKYLLSSESVLLAKKASSGGQDSLMKVGRSAIREALKVLIHLGFIERRNKVTCVSERVKEMLFPNDIVERLIEHRNLLHMIEAPKIIEPDIASLAATRCGREILDLIGKAVEAMKVTLEDSHSFFLHDYEFHVHLAEGTKNEVLIQVIKATQKNLGDQMREIKALPLRSTA